jgi:hypothetical protein
MLTLKLLYALIVIVYGNTENSLCPFLTDYILIQMLLERPWCNPWSANVGRLS